MRHLSSGLLEVDLFNLRLTGDKLDIHKSVDTKLVLRTDLVIA